jgi:hypothetical protein
MQSKKTIIGSWNLRNFSTKRDLNQTASIIGRFSLIALQEIRSEAAVEKMAKILGWQFRVSEPICNTGTSAHQTGKRKERYAFMWDPLKIQLIEEPRLVHADTTFVRPPFIGFFAVAVDGKTSGELVRGGFDFIFSTIHVVWGKKKDRDLEIAGVGKYLEAVLNHANGEKDIFLCGDFNEPPEKFSLGSGWKNLINGGTVVGSGSRYDNIWVSGFVKPEEGDVYKDFQNSSDHWPIWAALPDIPDDDEGLPDLNIDI